MARPTADLAALPDYWLEARPHLSRQVKFYLWHGLASSTRKTYSTGQKLFREFITLNPKFAPAGMPFPASTDVLLEFLAWLTSHNSRQPRTIKQYLGHVRALHEDLDFSTAGFEAPIIQRMLRGIKRWHGQRARKPKLPITVEILRKLVAHTDAGTASGATAIAAYSLAFSALLRCGEFTVDKPSSFKPDRCLTRGSVEFLPSFDEPTHILLHIPASKTDPFRTGSTVPISAAPGSPTCPVAALKRLFELDPRDPSAPLFCDGNGDTLTRADFIRGLKLTLAAAGIDETGYSGHSFRRGGATAAYICGISDTDIQRMGRWRSDAFRLYLDSPLYRTLSLSARLHGALLAVTPYEPPSLRRDEALSWLESRGLHF